MDTSVRDLPPNDHATIQGFTNTTLEDHYVTFILYCNPTLPDSLSTTELRRGFRSVPRTDGKSFETLAVFRLVTKLEKGEIPSWIALVTELGVEPPDLTKGGSGQKLQQYGVRLKRWARAYHIDAFFQYLLGNTRSYFTQIPKGPDALLTSRDGVPLEDDLALRALLPDLRPKRGRRKGYEDDAESIDTPSKRLRAGTPSTVDGRNSPRPDIWGRVSQSPAPSYIQQPNSHIPQMMTGPPRTQPTPVYEHEDHLTNLFSAAARAFSGETLQTAPPPAMPRDTPHMQHMNPWSGSTGRPHNEYPQSAIDLHAPANVFDSPDLNDGSRSAHPLAVSNSRSTKSKKRGISTTWNPPGSSNQMQEGVPKPRGRPPQNQNLKNGPFETWSVKQSVETDRENEPPFFTNGEEASRGQAVTAPMQQNDISLYITASTPRRIPTQKLSLTVPQQPSGNVRLATPPMTRELAKNSDATLPPRLTINDDGSLSRPRSSISKTREQESDRERGRQRSRLFAEGRIQRRSSADFFNTIDEEASQNEEYDVNDNGFFDEDTSSANGINWKHRAQVLARRLKHAQDELRRVKKAVLEAVM